MGKWPTNDVRGGYSDDPRTPEQIKRDEINRERSRKHAGEDSRPAIFSCSQCIKYDCFIPLCAYGEGDCRLQRQHGNNAGRG